MGSNVSKEELLEGSCVVGKHNERVEMWPSVAGEQLPRGGWWPGHRWLRQQQPRRLTRLTEELGTSQLYADFKEEVVQEADGFTCWQSTKVESVVERYQPKFNAKGMSVAYHHVKWHHQNGKDSSSEEHRYWFEFAPAAPIDRRFLGTWDLAAEQTKDAKRVDRLTVTLDTCGDVGFVRVDGTRKVPVLSIFKMTWDFRRPVTFFHTTTTPPDHPPPYVAVERDPLDLWGKMLAGIGKPNVEELPVADFDAAVMAHFHIDFIYANQALRTALHVALEVPRRNGIAARSNFVVFCNKWSASALSLPDYLASLTAMTTGPPTFSLRHHCDVFRFSLTDDGSLRMDTHLVDAPIFLRQHHSSAPSAPSYTIPVATPVSSVVE